MLRSSRSVKKASPQKIWLASTKCPSKISITRSQEQRPRNEEWNERLELLRKRFNNRPGEGIPGPHPPSLVWFTMRLHPFGESATRLSKPSRNWKKLGSELEQQQKMNYKKRGKKKEQIRLKKHEKKTRELRRLAYSWVRDHHPLVWERLRRKAGLQPRKGRIARKKRGPRHKSVGLISSNAGLPSWMQ